MTHLQSHLAQNGITQAEFADRIGVHQGMVSKMCRGVARPGLTLAARIEAVTGGAIKATSWVDPANENRGAA